ncbi:MAG: glucose-1-phosphate cytidylyltransferase [Flavobacteriales bacterium]|jgi:glucose-1-phosphate cytidylyltransferase|nr:glucose-1-phosphate cytidylyltransferase [Flavobacteriales bacterium]MBT3964210.1 glucose-1-phosphate cytidylyltransferase [Flavobacteriales bacterium]MBT4704157.1 glucose-1-phosphate cytidylyltransferase [Flavobacteriales bacterium]MBT4930023.1 glucose-1-phosphate cytidylyltransferase [Flavobacteriales bacterium]MBT5132397.1 glucose-1-phosphate cytidylyltransferase [Flavobacteriales bacterium]
MKVVIFAGGKGTRISEESHLKPKPMIEVGGKPILWHIMKIYAAYGHTEFIICCGYKGYMIKEYFYHYFLHNSDMTFDLSNNEMTVHTTNAENIKVTLVDTGLETMTAGRLKRVQEYVGNERFMLTYGDGVCDIDMEAQLKFHESNGAAVTMSIVQPGSRFGMIELDENNRVSEFTEKPQEDGAWINGGFFICEPKAFEYLPDQADDVMWERSPLEKLTADGELAAYRHHGFWKCMDTLRDNVDLNDMWDDKPKWKNW